MPKRPVTPPTEAPYKYFTVHCPFPAEPNLGLEAHQMELSFWISNALGGSNHLIAIFYKPKSDKVILEINEEYREWRHILGEHRWAEFLRTPTEEEAKLKSQIFFSTQTHPRDLQKKGWKRIDVKDEWFSKWSLFNRKIMYPYPATHFCETPSESDAVQEHLCRPLPVDYFPRAVPNAEPTAGPAAPPGSLPYVEEKMRPTGAWARGSSTVKAAAQSSSKGSAPPGLSASKLGKRNQNTSSPISAPVPVMPSLSRLNINTSSSSDLSYATPAWTPTPALSPDSVGNSSSDGDNAQTTPITPGDVAEAVLSEPSINVDETGEEEEIDDWGIPMTGTVSEYMECVEEPSENLWADYGQTQEPAAVDPDEILCLEHGKLCRHGICAQYKKQKKEHDKRVQDAERKKALDARVKKNGAQSSLNSSDSVRGGKVIYNRPQRSKPPHLVDPSNISTPANTGIRADDAPTALSSETTATPGPRQKPAHLSRPSATTPSDPNAPRPVRGRRMNSNNPGAASTVARPPPPAVGPSGWAHIPRSPWGASVGKSSLSGKVPDDAKSVAASSTGGWGHPSTPWDLKSAGSAPSAKKNRGKGKAKMEGKTKKTWAEQMEDEDDSRSVAESTTGGWGTISNGPWS